MLHADDAQLDEELAKLLETHTPEEIMEQMKEAGLVPDETVEEFPVTAGLRVAADAF